MTTAGMLEIERKFLVRGEERDWKALASGCRRIVQGYICTERGRTVRVRRQGDRAFLTIKGPSSDTGLSRYEFEKEITLGEARRLFALCLPGIIEKDRWLVPFEGHVFEVDEFHGRLEGLVVCEVELRSEGEPFAPPPFLGREVTGDRRYYNSQLLSAPAPPEPPEKTY